MHREPRPRDIVRVPGSTGPEIVISLTGQTLTLAPLLGEGSHTVTCGDWRRVRLVGVASPRSHGRHSGAPRAPVTAPEVATIAAPPDVPAPSVVRGSYGSGGTARADLY